MKKENFIPEAKGNVPAATQPASVPPKPQEAQMPPGGCVVAGTSPDSSSPPNEGSSGAASLDGPTGAPGNSDNVFPTGLGPASELLPGDAPVESPSPSQASGASILDDIFGVADEHFPIDDDSRAELFRAIEDAVVLGNPEMAGSLLEQFKKTYGGGPDFLYLTGRLLRQQGEVRRAYEIFKKLYFEWPVFMMERKDYEDLRDFLMSDLLERGRSQWNKVLALAARHATQEAASAVKGEAPPPLAIDDVMMADMEKLLSLYEHILEIEPRQPVAIKGLIQCYGELGRLEKNQEAQDRLREAQSYWNELSGKRAQAVLIEAREMVKNGREEETIAVLNIGLDSSPLHTGLLYFKAEVLRRMTKFKEALSCLDVFLRESPTDAEGLKLKKKIQGERVGELIGKGLAFLQEAEDRPAGSSQLKEKVKEALSFFYDALDLDANNVKALGGIYRGQMMTNNTLKAKKTMERIKEIDPRFQLSQLSGPLNNGRAKDEPGCFVATRLYGPHHSKTQLLRRFREETLRRSLPGRVFICMYARIGPRLAALPEKGIMVPLLRKAVDSVIRSIIS